MAQVAHTPPPAQALATGPARAERRTQDNRAKETHPLRASSTLNSGTFQNSPEQTVPRSSASLALEILGTSPEAHSDEKTCVC